MPHITIEYSENVAEHYDIQALLDVIHQATIDHGSAPLAGVRTRAAGRQYFAVADSHPDNAFIAIHARLGPGRDEATKKSLVADVLDAAEAHADKTDSPLAIAWSMEVTELDANVRVNRNYVATRMESEPESKP